MLQWLGESKGWALEWLEGILGDDFWCSQWPALRGASRSVGSGGRCRGEILSRRAQRSKKFNLARNFQSRSKFLISLENFNLDVSNSSQKIRPRWVARSKISFSLEIFNLAQNLEFFWIFGPSGYVDIFCISSAKSPNWERVQAQSHEKVWKESIPLLALGRPKSPKRVKKESKMSQNDLLLTHFWLFWLFLPPAAGRPRIATPPACYRSLSGPSGPKCPGSVPRGVSGALRAPGSGVSKKCPESVPGVSKRCPGHSGDTLGTLFGHSGARGPKRPRDTPRDTLGTLPRHFGREGPERLL